MRLGDVEAEACVRGEALGVHAVEDGDASVDVVVELDVMLSLMGGQESSDVLGDSPLNASGKARNNVSSSGRSKPSHQR